jgi:hypothetical protein
VLGPIAHRPSTWVTVASLDLNLLGLVHSFEQGHQDTLDIRPGSSCSGELKAGPGDFGLAYSGTFEGETLAEVGFRPTYESKNYLCGGVLTNQVTLGAGTSTVPVGVGSIAWSPRGRSLDDYVRSSDRGASLPEAWLNQYQVGGPLVALTRQDKSELFAGQKVDIPYFFH